MQRSRLVPLLLLVGGLGLSVALGSRLPKDQTLRFVLGDAAAEVTDLRVRYREASAADDDWAREADFRFDPGKAPRIVSHQARLVDGDHWVEVELSAGTRRAQLRRRVTFEGGSVSIDLSRALVAGGR